MYIKRARDSAQERKNPVREKPHQGATKADKTEEENLEQVRQWQKHYRKLFPTFVFYFESIPEDARVTYTKQVTALGAVSYSKNIAFLYTFILTVYIAGG